MTIGRHNVGKRLSEIVVHGKPRQRIGRGGRIFPVDNQSAGCLAFLEDVGQAVRVGRHHGQPAGHGL